MSQSHKSDSTTEHAYVTERLSAYLDGQLSPKESASVNHHLARCAHCQWNLRTLKQTVEWTRALPQVALPRSFAIPVPARPVRELRWRWTAPVLQGATVLVALLFFVAVAGNAYLARIAPAAPAAGESFGQEPAADQEMVAKAVVEAQPTQAPAEVQVEVTMEVEAPVAEAPMAAASVAEALSTEVPAPAAPAEVEWEATVIAAQTAAPPGAGAISPLEQPVAATAGEAAIQEEAAPSEPLERAAVGAGAEPTITASAEPTVAATAASVVAAVEPAPEADEPLEAAVPQEPEHTWLGRVVLGLGIAFVILGSLTAVVMIRRLRAA